MELLKAFGMGIAALVITVVIIGGFVWGIYLRSQDKKRKDDQFKNLQNS